MHGFTRLTLAVGLPLASDRGRVRRRLAPTASRSTTTTSARRSGTAGALAGIDGLDEPFLMMNGDVITTLDFGELLAHAPAVATRSRSRRRCVRATIDFGVLRSPRRRTATCSGRRAISRSRTATTWSRWACTSSSPHLLRLIEPGAYLDFPDLVLQALGRRRARRLLRLRRAVARHRPPRGLRARDRGESGHSERPAPGLAQERRGPRARACPRARGRLTVASRSCGRAGAASPP